MTAITVRAREPRDLEAITQIFNCPSVVAGTLQLPYRSIEERREWLSHSPQGTHSLVAEIDGRVVGQLGLHPTTNPRRRHCASIGMAVHDDFQGQRVGSALMAAMLELADRWLDLRRIELQVYADNAAAVHLYEKFGFVIEGSLRAYAYRSGAYVDTYAMARLRE
ncbi:MAG: GNAT family N-acetyltransferase [Thermomicrobiales bacterium]